MFNDVQRDLLYGPVIYVLVVLFILLRVLTSYLSTVARDNVLQTSPLREKRRTHKILGNSNQFIPVDSFQHTDDFMKVNILTAQEVVEVKKGNSKKIGSTDR